MAKRMSASSSRHVCDARRGCDAAVAIDGQLVCPHTGRVVGPIFVSGMRSVAESMLASDNAVGPLGMSGTEHKMFDEHDRQEQVAIQEHAAILDVVRAALAIPHAHAPAIPPTKEPLLEAYVAYRWSCARAREDQDRVKDLAKRIHAYYRWCVRHTSGSRVPKLRLFVLAILYVMVTGLSAAGVFVVPACTLCKERLPEISKIPPSVLKDRQRALTTAIKFVKSTFGDVVVAQGSFRLLQNLTETFTSMSRS